MFCGFFACLTPAPPLACTAHIHRAQRRFASSIKTSLSSEKK